MKLFESFVLESIIYFSFTLLNICVTLKLKMVTSTATTATSAVNPREKALEDFRRKIIEHKEIEARLKQSIKQN